MLGQGPQVAKLQLFDRVRIMYARLRDNFSGVGTKSTERRRDEDFYRAFLQKGISEACKVANFFHSGSFAGPARWRSTF
jgi:hypothetical protein